MIHHKSTVLPDGTGIDRRAKNPNRTNSAPTRIGPAKYDPGLRGGVCVKMPTALFYFANNCLMTMCAELADPKNASFPALIASHFGLTPHNAAHSGGSNCRILGTTLQWIAEYIGSGCKPEDLFVLIGWIAPDRREIGHSYLKDAPDADFLSVSRDSWRVPIGAMSHPLGEGHRRWSGLLIDHIRRDC
jgi:hypothetical protein